MNGIQEMLERNELEDHIRVLESAVAELNREIEFLKASDIVSSIQINVFMLMNTAFAQWAGKQAGKDFKTEIVPELLPTARKGLTDLREACAHAKYPDWLAKAVTDGVAQGLDRIEQESQELRKRMLGPAYVG